MSAAGDESALHAARERRLGRSVLLVSVLVFLAQGVPLAREVPLWNENTAAVPGPIFREIDSARIDETGPIPTKASCEAGHFVYSTMRPNAKLCSRGPGRQLFGWPILIMSYASGITLWPLVLASWLSGPNFVLVRIVGLSIGVLSLLLLYDVVSIFSGVRRAAATVAIASVSSSLILTNALAAYFEMDPPVLTLLAIGLLARARQTGPSARRSMVAGILFGLALVGNLKMVVPLSTLLMLAILFRAPVLHAGRRVLSFGALGVILGFVPIFIIMVGDPFGEVFNTGNKFLMIALERLSPVFVWGELKNILIFAVDLAYYLELAAGRDAPLPPTIFLIAAAVGLLFSMGALLRAARGQPADASVVSSIAILLVYLVFVGLVYNQIPPNYTPVLLAFAPCFGISLVEIGERIGRSVPRHKDVITAAVVLGGVLLFAMGTNWRSDEWVHGFTSIDIRVEESIAAALRTRSGERELPLVTPLYSHAGVFDALGATSAPSISIHPDLNMFCGHTPDVLDCLTRRLMHLLCPAGRLPLRFILSFGAPTEMDADHPAEIREGLWLAANSLGLKWTDEKRVLLPSGIGGLLVVRVDEGDSPARCQPDG